MQPHMPAPPGKGAGNEPANAFRGSCDKDAGDQIFWYDEEYTTGTNHMDILNYPGLYIDSGDYVAEDSEASELTASDSSFELVLGVRNDD